jgi:hypothetical protein
VHRPHRKTGTPAAIFSIAAHSPHRILTKPSPPPPGMVNVNQSMTVVMVT